MLEAIQSMDFAVLDWIQENLTCGFSDTFFSLITHLGDAGLFWIAVGIIFLCTKRFRKAGFCLLIAIFLGFIVCNLILKPSVARVRPYADNELMKQTIIDLIRKLPSDKSFPSGHTTASVAASLAIFYHHKKVGTGAVILAVLIAFSRLYLYVHFPTDVLVGAIVGIAASIGAWAIVNKAFPWYRNRRALRKAAASAVEQPPLPLDASESASQD